MPKKLLSLPPNLVGSFHAIQNVSRDEYYCTSDPVGRKLGSGGGTTWLLEACHQEEAAERSFADWLQREKRILLHAGGQSRRLPSYAPSGKVLTPIPVFRWKRGQRISQNLLELQLPLYERIMNEAPDSLRTLIASGDVCIEAGKLQTIPEADVICYGLWVDPSLAKNHGVFLARRDTPTKLDFVLQKPSVETIGKLMQTHFCLMDIGIWLLSDRAVNLLAERSKDESGEIRNYDLYSDFGCALGENPTKPDSLLADLTVAILPLQDGEFYHYGTTREMISSTVALQNKVIDQPSIVQVGVRPHPSIFIQNAHLEVTMTAANENTWIENAWIGKNWRLQGQNVVTGVPENDWTVSLSKGICVDVVPISGGLYAVRPYGFNDAFRGPIRDAATLYLGRPVTDWLDRHGLTDTSLSECKDLQSAPLFPVTADIQQLGRMFQWMIADKPETALREEWLAMPRLSADQISDQADLLVLHAQRQTLMADALAHLARNHRESVFYQTNLLDMAEKYVDFGLSLPAPLTEDDSLLKRSSDSMFRSRYLQLSGKEGAEEHKQKAFQLLREGLTRKALADKQMPRMSVCTDQIVWSRSPVRIDLAGGWTDTPPYCLTNGGNVVNIAINLNGQPPLQTYVKPCKEPHIILRSIDLGAVEVVETYEQLRDFAKVGSPFSIPKAALALAGFLPEFCQAGYPTLRQQLQDFGCGIEVTLFSAIPAGSGLGTSSILASTVLGSISDFCQLGWDKPEICNRTLVLEQLLTTGGGWQDQYGGVLPGVKLLQTKPGFDQTPEVRWTASSIYDSPETAGLHLLYYTGITRTAKQILAEIVSGMFLYDTDRLRLLSGMKGHALDVYEAFQKGDCDLLGRLVRKTWTQNQRLDSGTNPAEVQRITSLIDDLCTGYKLPGAGGGGYLYMIAKDAEAVRRIRQILTDHRPNDRARFVDLTLSHTGMQVSRS